MTRAWIFQANPGHYDLDGALEALDRIWWRVPQHTSEIHVGDVGVLWRSGSDAGIVGIGRVVAEPRLTPMDPAEAQFVLGGSEDVQDTTRALVRVRPVPYVSRETVRQMPALRDHQIVRAPMGTVFPLTDEQWRAVAAALPDPPEAVPPELGALPPTWGWEQRAKGVLPMPGGYSGYLDSLELVCAAVAEERPTPSELPAVVERVLGVRATAARLRAAFLRKVGIVVVEDGLCRLSAWARRWRDSRDSRVIAALLQARCQFVGEMLAAALAPRTTDELLAVANEQYGMGWDTPAQVSNRRGWLQSSGMLDPAGDGMVRASAAGRALLEELTLHEPETLVATEPEDTAVESVPPAEAAPAPTEEPSVSERPDVRAQALIDELRAAATDSRDPDRLERAVRDAFAFLGFRAEWLGGSGKTDVLLDAMLGRDDSYRVILDCKSVGSGTLADQQIDWVTLGEHKHKHDADHVAVVGPRPSGSRLFERAKQHEVAVISVERLVGVCSQHAKTPLTLDDYRALFVGGAEPDTQTLDERAEEVARQTRLVAAVCDAIRERSGTFGRLTARDLYLILTPELGEDVTSQDELQTVLDVLASPVLEILDGDAEAGYRVTSSADVSARRVAAVAGALTLPGTDGDAPSASV